MSENPVREAIQEAITDHPVILFMKGTPEQPMCGFSARTVAALEARQVIASHNDTPDPAFREPSGAKMVKAHRRETG